MEQGKIELVRKKMSQMIIGKDEAIDLALITLFAQGHLLIEDVPGVGKTTLAKNLAKVLGCEFTRIQFTPDTLPSDVTGVSVYRMNTGTFSYMPGSIMSQIVLADEINRATEKTQASLLEAMGEYQVSVDGKTYPLPKPFMVMATENPIDELGTYTLPEAQLDRFMMQITLGYPTLEEDIAIVNQMLSGQKKQEVTPILSAQDIVKMQQEVEQVYLHPDLLSYMATVVSETRKNEYLLLGASPRALLAWAKASQASAYCDARDYVIPDDVIKVMNPVLLHRMIVTADARMNQMTVRRVLGEIRSRVLLPILLDAALSTQESK